MSADRNRKTRRNWMLGNKKLLSQMLGSMYLHGGAVTSPELEDILIALGLPMGSTAAITFVTKCLKHDIIVQGYVPHQLGYVYRVGARGKAFFEGQLFTGDKT